MFFFETRCMLAIDNHRWASYCHCIHMSK